MKKLNLMTCALICTNLGLTQLYVVDFENPVLASESAWYGQDQVIDGDTIYNSGIFNFELNYNSSWGTSTGWTVSNITDNITPGYGNQYSAITGSGTFGSSQYGICYVSDWSNNRVFYDGSENIWYGGISVTNTTYAYYSMLNGDAFGKPFGSDTSAAGIIDGTNGEDWFLLTIYALGLDSLPTGDSVNFYLADYRFADDSLDYIINDWTWINLTSLGQVYGLDFALSSSDTSGGWGMNTPSYFAMDDLEGGWVSLEEDQMDGILLYPNPASEVLTIEVPLGSKIVVSSIGGQLIATADATDDLITLDIRQLDPGIYVATVIYEGFIWEEKFIKY